MNIRGWFPLGLTWLDILAVQGTLKSLLQHHSSKASILQHPDFFIGQLSHPYMTTRKTIALTIQMFVGKMMFLLFNTLSRFVIAFLPRSKSALISWLQSLSTVILEPKKITSVTVSILSPSICHEVWDQLPWSSFFECGVLSQLFHFSSSTFIKRLFSSFAVCHESGKICLLRLYIHLLEIESSLWFILPCISHDVLCM